MKMIRDDRRNPKFGKNLWATPPSIFDPLNSVYHFGLDAAANRDNHQCPTFFNEEGLIKLRPKKDQENPTDFTYVPGGALGNYPWAKASRGKAVWLNPPWSGPLLRKFIDRAIIESVKVTVVCLLPATTEVRWFQRLSAYAYTTFIFIKGRVVYLDPVSKQRLATPQYGSLIAVLGPRVPLWESLTPLDSYMWSPFSTQ